MNPTDTVDVHDPPVRTVADLEREQAERIQALRDGWGKNYSMLTGSGRGGSCATIPSAGALNRAMKQSDGDKDRAARLFGVTASTLSKWMHERDVYEQWALRRVRPVYSNTGDSWPSIAIAARALHMHPNSIKDAIREVRTLRKCGVMLDHEPFGGVTYDGGPGKGPKGGR